MDAMKFYIGYQRKKKKEIKRVTNSKTVTKGRERESYSTVDYNKL